MPLTEIIDYVKTYGGICAPLLLAALLWMNAERKEAQTKYEAANEKLANLSERTMVILTEIKGLFGHRL